MTTTSPPGDPRTWSAFETEALPHADRLFRLAMWVERNRQEAEDLVQETMTQALRSFHRYEPGTNCAAWLMTIFQRVRSNRRRARTRSPEMGAVEPALADTVAFVPPVPEHLTDEDVIAALRRLPPDLQEVILLCDVQELKYREIADVVGIPIGTVMSRLNRGRTLLRRALGEAPVPRADEGSPR